MMVPETEFTVRLYREGTQYRWIAVVYNIDGQQIDSKPGVTSDRKRAIEEAFAACKGYSEEKGFK